MGEREDGFAVDVSWYTIAEAVPVVVGIATLVFLSHSFSPTAYGRYAVVLSIVAVLNTFLFGWVEQSILRFETEHGVDLETAVVGVTITLSALVVTVGVIGYAVLEPILGAYRPFYLGTLALLVAQGVFKILRAMLQAQLRSQKVTWLELGRSVLKLGVGVVVVLTVVESIAGWIWASAIATAVMAVLGLRKTFGHTRVQLNSRVARRMFGYGGPLVFWLIGFTLLEFADRLLLEWLGGADVVGVYSSHYTIASRGVLLVLTPIVQAAHPIMMNTWSGDNHDEFETVVTRFTRYFFICGLPATVGVAVLGPSLTQLILDTEYYGTPFVIPLVAGGLFLWNLSMIGHKGLEIQERTAVMSGAVLLAVCTNIVLNVPLIQSFGATGAATATLISFGLYPAIIYVVSQNGLRWRFPMGTVRNTVVAVCVMLLPFLGLYTLDIYPSARVFLMIPVAGSIYFGALYALGEFKTRELARVKAAVREVI